MGRKTGPPKKIAGYDPLATAGDCHWDAEAADHAADFFPECLTHVKGFSGTFDLIPWQRDFVRTLFGWKRPDGTRRYREALVAVPRKNGKSLLAAGLGLYCLRCDQERGPEVYCAAATADQATMVFGPAASMVRQNPLLSKHLKVLDATKRILSESNGGFLRAIPAEAAQAHGFNASAVIFDELHTQPSRDLYDVLKTSQGARSKSAVQDGRGGPLFVSITTAGHDRHSICFEVWQHARNVRDGINPDPHFLPVLYELAEAEDWTDRKVWKRVNPNLDVSISMDFLEEEFSRATAIPAYENTFRNLYLNQWTEQAVRWLPLDKWDACGGGLPLDKLQGCECWCGLDLSTTTDVSAFAMAFRLDDLVQVVCRFWVPEESAIERERRDRVPYRQWAQQGFLTMTPGNSIDYDIIRAEINQLRLAYNIRQIAIDRWNATQLAGQLQGDGFDCGMFGQGYASMSSPSKELERLVVDNLLRHSGNPVLRWMAANVAVEMDAAGNLKPSKARSMERIDGIVATIMALGSMALAPAAPTGPLFVY